MSNLRTALTNIIDDLKEKYPLNLWMVTRVVGDDWILLATSDNEYGVEPDQVKFWKDTICSRMVNNAGPNIAPKVSEVELYLEAPIVTQIPIKCYIGYPLKDEEGKLIGTLCAIDPDPGTDELYSHDNSIRRIAFTVQCLLSQYNELSLLRAIVKNYPELLQNHSSQENYNNEFKKIASQFKSELKEVGALLGFLVLDKDRKKTTVYNLKLAINVELIRKNLRPQDIIFKLNEERIVILLPDIENKALTKTVVNLFNTFSKEPVHIKIGAHLSKQNESVEDALENAKIRMIS